MRNIVEVIKSFSNLPKEYKLVLIRAFNTLFEAITELDEIKVDKEEGKGLSENDFTDELKEKLDSIDEGATVQVPSDWNSISGVTKILNKPDLTVYPDSAEWNKTDKKIYFKHNGTVLNPFTIDGTYFIKDGMIDSVKIEDNNLVITFNTDAGKEDIELPLSEIFNPDNYYTKIQIDNLFVKKVNGKDLSSNDFTDELKEKLENLEPGGNVNGDWDENDSDSDAYINNRTHWKERTKQYNKVLLTNTNTIISAEEFIDMMENNISSIITGEEYEIKLWDYTDEDAEAVSLMVYPDEIKLIIHYAYPNALNYTLSANIDQQTGVNNPITIALFTNGVYDFEPSKVYMNVPQEVRYEFVDKGFDIDIYHKLDKRYLPDDIGVEGLTNEEIDELIAD